MKKQFFYIIIPLLLIILLQVTCVFDVSIITEAHLNLIITVSSIFAGFLFSGLSIILGFGANKTIVTLIRVGVMNHLYFQLGAGIVFSLATVAASALALVFERSSASRTIVVHIAVIYFLFVAIIFFLLSTKRIFIIIKSSHNEIANKYPGMEDKRRVFGESSK
ncbi:MAG: hypothetical protein FWE11_08335 [Defluviitaleaceae bacterium]|nr:hypothetical protein [Defluviitaleaceae bacterium]